MLSSHPQALLHLRKITRLLALLILALVVAGFFMPTTYKVERTIDVAVSVSDARAFLHQKKSLASWMYIDKGQIEAASGKLAEGDELVISYSKTDKKGELLVSSLSPDVLQFDVVPKPGVHPVHNILQIMPVDGGVRIIWLIEGELHSGLFSPYIAMVANRIAGKNFDVSLKKLKALLENN